MTTRRMLRAAGIAGFALLIAGVTVWAALAIYYSNLGGEPLRLGLAAAFALGTLGAFLFLPNRRRTLVGFGAAVRRCAAVVAFDRAFQ